MKDLLCKFKGYEVEGIAWILCWGGQEGHIRMDKRFIESEKDINKAINDAGFGCQRIMYAWVHVYAIFDHEARLFLYDKYVNLLNPDEEVPAECKENMERFY